jgi:hypothetical protein|tara:strand:+ start:1713 stop:1901 length:189 start_codon:yes stop_codon:yes gene_type:complete
MIYKFKNWVYVPAVSEIYIEAESDEKALQILKGLDPKTFNWEECQLHPIKTFYEVIKKDEKS